MAEQPHYQVQLLQLVPMLDILDSRKIAKSGQPQVSKPSTAAAKHSKPAAVNQQGSPSEREDGSELPVKGKKRQRNASADASEDQPSLAKPIKTQSADGASKFPAESKKQRQSAGASTAQPAVAQDSKTSLADDVTGFTGRLGQDKKPGKKHTADAATQDTEAEIKIKKGGKSKQGKQKLKQSSADNGSRSFLADVLDPAKSDSADVAASANAVTGSSRKTNIAKATKSATAEVSGLVAVVDAATGKTGRKAKQEKGSAKAVDAHDGVSRVSGSNAAELLQSRVGVASLQVGMGGSPAWE